MKFPGILTNTLGASNAGPSLGLLDSRYLKLDASNDPLTGSLEQEITTTLSSGTLYGKRSVVTLTGAAGSSTTTLYGDSLEISLAGDFDGGSFFSADSLQGRYLDFDMGSATTSGTYKPTVNLDYCNVTLSSSASNLSSLDVAGTNFNTASTDVTDLRVRSITGLINSTVGTATLFDGVLQATGSGAITTLYGVKLDLDDANLVANTGTIYGVHADVGGAGNYSFYAVDGLASFQDGLEVVGTTTLDTGLTGFLQASSGVVSAGSIGTGDLPSTVMLEGENVSLLTNDSGYLTTVDISSDTNLSATSPVTLTGDVLSFDFSVANTWTGDQLLGTDTELRFRDADLRIYSPADGEMRLSVDNILSIYRDGTQYINLNSTDIDLYKPLYIQGTASGSSATLTLGPTIPDSVGTTVNLLTALPFYTPASGSTFNGLNFLCLVNGSNAITAWNGVYAIAAMGTYGGTATDVTSFRSNPIVSNASSTITNLRHVWCNATTGATITNHIGVDIATLVGTNTWAIRTGNNLCLFGGDVEIDGALNHDGSTLGFFGTAPATQAAAYTPTNVSADRSFDANSTTLDEVADVLGTLIADLQSYGLLQ